MYEVTQEKTFTINDRKVKLSVEKSEKTTKVTITDMWGEVLATRYFSRSWKPRHWNLTTCKGGWDAELSYTVGRGAGIHRSSMFLDL
jgi:hypothetical protein